ncbi:MAG: cupin [Burkholderiales bacterium RIFCSPLOWO2_02_FULL_57_36]|nr:MAG: cupin [Burkholderiales bacterium RIFCSPLOWO2_02_FULL_57_36]
MKNRNPRTGVIYLPPGEGRSYAPGKMQSVFKADREETSDAYSISEWWLDPFTKGPGAHSHEANDDIFYVLEGTVRFLAGSEAIDASKGAFLRVPAGVTHDFENTTAQRAGFLNIYIPGGFEKDMPAIVDWFKNNGG